jgi:uncharacterized membrane protein YccC
MQKSLAEELAALREELARARTADPDLLTVLSRVVHDVTTLTAEQSPASATGSLGARLEAQALLFESEHPAVAAAVRRVVAALSDLGI